MKSVVTALLLALCLAASAGSARADEKDDIRRTYLEFVAAQNAHDLARVGAFFVDGPQFLWVSDGRSYWGREAVLARMGSFQKAALWRVEPDLPQSTVIMLDDNSAILHLPLTLVIGGVENPDRLRFLVSAAFRRIGDTWKIAALLTTTEKPG